MAKATPSRTRAFGIVTGLVGLLAFGGSPRAEVKIVGGDGWELGLGGVINAFVPYAKWDQGNGQEATTRVSSGFNPSKLDFQVRAPRWGTVDVSGHLQLAPSIQANKAKFAGNSIEARILDIVITGPFGTVSAGRSWSIFNSQAIIHDSGSGLGVGRMASPDRGGPAFGRIGTGYTYTDFGPRLAYTTPVLGGFQLAIGAFDPIEVPFGGGTLPSNAGGMGVGALETSTPRLETEASFGWAGTSAGFKLWAGALHQRIKDLGTQSTTAIRGADGGARFSALGFGLTGSYTASEGVGASGFQGNGFVCDSMGCRAARADFWYLGLDYTYGKTTLGLSTGMGRQKARDGFDKVDNRLHVAFLHRQLVPNLQGMLEVHRFESETSDALAERYNAFILGGQYGF
jgi:hypothetical protein